MRLQEKETINVMPKMLWEKLDEDDKKEYLEKWKETSQNQGDKSHFERNINLVESLQSFPDDEEEYQERSVNNIMTEGFYNFVENTLADSHEPINTTKSCGHRHKVRYHESKVSINKVQVSKVFNSNRS